MKKICVVASICCVLLAVLSSFASASTGTIGGKIDEYRWSLDVTDSANAPDCVRVSSSDYYLIFSEGYGITTFNGIARTIKVYPDNGTIQKSNVDKYRVSSVCTRGAVIAVNQETYATVYDNIAKTTVATIHVHVSNGDIVGTNDTQALSMLGRYVDVCRIGSTNKYAVAYYISTNNTVWYEIVNISSSGAIDPPYKTVKVSNNGKYPRIQCFNDTSDKILVDFVNTTSVKGTISVYNITSSVKIDSWEYDVAWTPVSYQIKPHSNIWIVARGITGGEGYVSSYWMNADGTFYSKGFIEGMTYSYHNASWSTIFNVDINRGVLGITYREDSNKGVVVTIPCSDTGGFGALFISNYTYNTTDSVYLCPVVHVSKDIFLLTYETHGGHGKSLTIGIDNSTWGVVKDALSSKSIFRNVTRYHVIDSAINGFFLQYE